MVGQIVAETWRFVGDRF